MPFTLKQFGILTEKTLLFLFIMKKDGQVIAFNNRCKVLFPNECDRIKGRYITDFVIDEDVPIFIKTISKLSLETPIVNESFTFPLSKTGVLSLKFDFTLHNDLVYVTGIDTTEEYKEHRALITISKLTKTGAWYFDVMNQEMYWTKGCYLIKELDPDTPMTRDLGASFYPKESRDRVENYLSTLIQNKEPYEYTEKIITHKGNEKWIKVVAQPVIYRNEVVYVNGTIADITDRHNYVEKLKYNEETKHLALKGIQSGLFDHFIDKKEVFYSEAFKKMLGLPLDTHIVPEQEFREMIHPDDIDKALKKHKNNLEKDGNHYHNQYRLRGKKGKYRFYEVHGFKRKNEKGETVRMVGNLIDVHQKKLSKKTIEESKKRLIAMVNNGMDYIILLNTKGEILMADEDSLKIIKRDFDVDPTGSTSLFIDVMPVNFKPSFADNFNEALKGNTIKKEIERVTHNGTNQWLETKYIPILDDASKVDSVLITFHDITEEKLAELAIKQAHIKEHELSELKSNILSNLSHEIRTPLNGIIAISTLLQTEENPEERIKLTEYLKESQDRLFDTLNTLGGFSEIESIQKNLNYSELDINYVVETSFREYRHLANAKKLEYTLDLDESCPQASIDENLFNTALNNIIHNAIKYTIDGSVQVKIKTKRSKKNIYIYIIDTGIGIDKDNYQKIFDPFVQESIGFSRKYEGTGMGLSLSKRYIEILGGSIKVKSKLGKGTEFIIIIPKCV
ncbi:PAS domain S-box protein [Aquimarina sp. AU474]|uniref:PAS domain S-box protein n=1 Tax=Aquimarina sp. AU474 TaxID=2108529 RepID=UPI000D68D2F0|nr:PAS domain S-box protein [Aquimarina sp. AU474]